MKKIAVLMGGMSKERDVSIVTGKACARGLRESGHHVTEVDVDRRVAHQLTDLAPDVCFNALHGPIGEDGSMQGLLNVLGIPYTHSGVAASSLAMDKIRSRAVAAQLGIPIPSGGSVERDEFWSNLPTEPFVLKPINGGSSIDTFVVRDPKAIPIGTGQWPFAGAALLEDLVVGDELTVTVLDEQALTVTQILTKEIFYDYKAKYTPNGSIHLLPAHIPQTCFDLCLQLAVAVHRAIGCRGISRTDFILPHDSKQPVFLEINTQPGMTPTSLAPEQAAHVGIPFPELMRRLVEAAATD